MKDTLLTSIYIGTISNALFLPPSPATLGWRCSHRESWPSVDMCKVDICKVNHPRVCLSGYLMDTPNVDLLWVLLCITVFRVSILRLCVLLQVKIFNFFANAIPASFWHCLHIQLDKKLLALISTVAPPTFELFLILQTEPSRMWRHLCVYLRLLSAIRGQHKASGSYLPD